MPHLSYYRKQSNMNMVYKIDTKLCLSVYMQIIIDI